MFMNLASVYLISTAASGRITDRRMTMIETGRVVFVDGPGPCNAKFLHDWFSAAKDADRKLLQLANMGAEEAKRSVTERDVCFELRFTL